MNTARPTGMLVHGSRSFVDWLTGTGFLMLHATCFFVALVVLIPWNLYSDPGDFWAADPLIRWAFLLAFHALLVGVWSLIRNVILKEEDDYDQTMPAARSWQTGRSTSTSVNFRTSSAVNPAAATTASALLAEEWARQWLVDSGEEVASNGSPDARSSTWGDYRTATAPVEWPQPPAPSVSAGQDEQEEEPEEDVALPAEPARTPGPLGAAARASTDDAQESEDAVDPELEWRWIEAAASAWLTRKERETLTNGHHPSPPPSHYDDEFASP